MKTRIISAIIILPILFLIIYYGGYPYYITIFLANLIGLYEFNRAFRIRDKRILVIQIVLSCILHISIIYGASQYFLLCLGTAFIVLGVVFVLSYPTIGFEQYVYAVFGYLYVTLFISHLTLIRSNGRIGYYMIWAVFAIAFLTDTTAYFVGRKWGKKKLAPNLSPNKTIAGAIGGLVGALVAMFIFSLVVGSFWLEITKQQFIGLILMGFLGSIVAQFGDLIASAIKRKTEIKDFGKIIPGHGGILDRLDSILVVSFVVYYAMQLIFN